MPERFKGKLKIDTLSSMQRAACSVIFTVAACRLDTVQLEFNQCLKHRKKRVSDVLIIALLDANFKKEKEKKKLSVCTSQQETCKNRSDAYLQYTISSNYSLDSCILYYLSLNSLTVCTLG